MRSWGTISLVAILLVAACSHDKKEAVPHAEGLAANESPCPGFDEQMQRMTHLSDAELTRIGAADALPETGATSRSFVSATVGAAKAAFPNASVRVGPGLGVTYSGSSSTTITYHHAPDYQLWVRFAHRDACPSMAAFVTNGSQRVPVFAVYAA